MSNIKSGVTVVNRWENIDRESILRVEKGIDNIFNIYEMRVSDFIRFTEPTPWIVGDKNIDSYLIAMLNLATVPINFITEAL